VNVLFLPFHSQRIFGDPPVRLRRDVYRPDSLSDLSSRCTPQSLPTPPNCQIVRKRIRSLRPASAFDSARNSSCDQAANFQPPLASSHVCRLTVSIGRFDHKTIAPHARPLRIEFSENVSRAERAIRARLDTKTRETKHLIRVFTGHTFSTIVHKSDELLGLDPKAPEVSRWPRFRRDLQKLDQKRKVFTKSFCFGNLIL